MCEQKVANWKEMNNNRLLRYWHKAMGFCKVLQHQWFVDLCLEMDKRQLKV